MIAEYCLCGTKSLLWKDLNSQTLIVQKPPKLQIRKH